MLQLLIHSDYNEYCQHNLFTFQGEIFTARFHPAGETLASAGFDRLICKFNCSQNQRPMCSCTSVISLRDD